MERSDEADSAEKTAGRSILGVREDVKVFSSPAGVPIIHRRSIIERGDGILEHAVFWGRVFVAALAIQSAFFLWSRIHPKSARITAFFALCLSPVAISRYFVIVVIACACLIVRHVSHPRKSARNLACALSSVVYVSCVVAFASQVVALILLLLGCGVRFPMIAFFFSLYFSVLSREIAFWIGNERILPVVKGASGLCPFCDTKMKQDNAVTLPCSHALHSGCVDRWILLAMEPVCPICKVQVKFDPVSFIASNAEVLIHAMNCVKFIAKFVFTAYVLSMLRVKLIPDR